VPSLQRLAHGFLEDKGESIREGAEAGFDDTALSDSRNPGERRGGLAANDLQYRAGAFTDFIMQPALSTVSTLPAK
jgi:hypothetical protein